MVSIGVLFSPVGILAVLLALAITCGGAYFVISRRPIKEVLLLRPRDRRGLRVPVVRETDMFLDCKKVDGVSRRFIKAGPAWMFATKGKVITRFLGVEGTAYTTKVKDGVSVNVPLPDGLKSIWGEDVYNTLPQDKKELIDDYEYGLTVEVEQHEDPDLPTMKSDDIFEASDTINLEMLAGAQKTSKKMEIYQFIMGAIAGAFIMYLAVMQGWL